MILRRCGNRYYPAVLTSCQDGAPKLYTDVLYDYEAHKEEELTIRAGDEVAVLKTDSFNGWLLCALHGRAGAVTSVLLGSWIRPRPEQLPRALPAAHFAYHGVREI